MLHNNFKYILYIIGFFVFSFAMFVGAKGVEAKSITWTWNWPNSNLSLVGEDPEVNGPDIYPTSYQAIYNAKIINTATGVEVMDGSTVSTGTNLHFDIVPYVNTDISWFATGSTWDTPYGYWVTNAGNPAGTWWTDVNKLPGWTSNNKPVYSVWSVNPPSISVNHTGSTATMTCSPDGKDCTITGAGSVRTNVIINSTNSRVYAYSPSMGGGVQTVSIWTHDPASCTTNPYFTCPTVAYQPVLFVLTIPQQTVSYTMTSVAPNNPPAPPTLGGPSTGYRSTNYTFTAQSADPEGNTVRYGFDWNMDGAVDQWAPASGYVASNSIQSALRQWTSLGNKTFQVLAEDSGSNRSAFTSKTINITNRAPNAPGITGPNSGSTGIDYTFTATSTDPDGDTLTYGFDWDRSGTVDEWLPGATSYVSSGTPQSKIKNYATNGSYPFQVLAKDSLGAQSSFSLYTISIGTTELQITGDVYSKDSFGTLTCNGANKIAVTGGDNSSSVSGCEYSIKSYNPILEWSSTGGSDWKNPEMAQNIDSLKKVARPIAELGALTGIKAITATIPEGAVYYSATDITLDNITSITGANTTIVSDGVINITGNLRANDPASVSITLGLIAKGGINISGTTNTINHTALFTPGALTVDNGAGNLTIMGLVASNTLNINRTSTTQINYGGCFIKSPPPGFTRFMLPSWQ